MVFNSAVNIAATTATTVTTVAATTITGNKININKTINNITNNKK
jgi:hypothetical protein